MNYQTLSLAVRRAGLEQNRVATITFERPEVRNAFNRLQRGEFQEAVKEVRKDSSIRALFLTGAGDDAFSSGQDPAEIVLPEDAANWMMEWGQVYRSILDLEIATVAVMNGFSAGAGFQVALLADIRIMVDDANFTFNEIEKGIPVITGTSLIAPLVSLSFVQDMVLTARRVNGVEALAAGIVSRVCSREQLPHEVSVLAESLVDAEPTAVRLNKSWWRELRGDSVDKALVEGARVHPIAYAAARSR